MGARYINKDNGEEYTLMEAIDYWCENYDYERVPFAEVFTLVKDTMVQLKFF